MVKEEREREREGWREKFGEITKQARGVQSRTELYCSVILFMVWLLAFVNSFCLRYFFFYFPRHYGELFLINYVKSRVVGLVKHSFVFFSYFIDLNSEIGIVIKLL